jgi:AcrR family transcriptional regulator
VAERPLRADAQRNRDKILRAARDAFAISGYGVPLDEIATIAGVGPGTVYRHFPTKEALFEAVVGSRLEDLIEDARGRAETADPAAAFFGFLARVAAEATTKRDLPDAITISGSLRTDLYAALDVLLHRAQQAGAVRDEITSSDLVVLLRTLFTSIRDDLAGEQDPSRYDRLFAVITDGLRRPTN